MTQRSKPTGIFANPRDGIMIRFENNRYRKITSAERQLIVAALCDDRRPDTDGRPLCVHPNAPCPSEPADRREIVARECADELVLIIEVAERVAKRTGNTFVLDRQRIAKMILGRFAALDGGR